MISHLRGTVLHKAPRYVVLDVGGVGYKVFTLSSVLDSIKTNQGCSFWTHFVVREDAHDIYGFVDQESLSFFEMLISISGIGPRTALNVLNIVSLKTLRQAVSSGDTSYLTKVSGIGRKIADKIVIELKDKFEAEEGDFSSEHMKGDADAIEALKSLGYQEREAREALKKISTESGHSDLKAGEKVKRALKVLGGKVIAQHNQNRLAQSIRNFQLITDEKCCKKNNTRADFSDLSIGVPFSFGSRQCNYI